MRSDEMPMGLDRTSTFEVVLRSDREKPKGRQPVFVCRFLSKRERLAFSEASDTTDALGTGAKGMAAKVHLLRDKLAGWRNMVAVDADGVEMPIPFDPARLADVLIYPVDVMDLELAMLRGQQLEARDLGNFSAPSPDNSDSSAPAAADPETATEPMDTDDPTV